MKLFSKKPDRIFIFRTHQSEEIKYKAAKFRISTSQQKQGSSSVFPSSNFAFMKDCEIEQCRFWNLPYKHRHVTQPLHLPRVTEKTMDAVDRYDLVVIGGGLIGAACAR